MKLYLAGAAIIRMLSHFLGEETFRSGLKKYLNAHKYANAKHDDLWEALTTQAYLDDALDTNTTVKEIMDSWTLKPGFPVIHAHKNGSTIHVTQVKFSFAPCIFLS